MAEPRSQFDIWLPPVLAAFSAAGLTAWFSLWRFRKERWWEKKFESYVAIMEALHNMVAGFDEAFEASAGGREVPPDLQRKLEEKHLAGIEEISKQINIGEFLLISDTTKTLVLLISNLENAKATNSHGEYLDRSSHAIHDCLDKIRIYARQELQGGWKPFL